jgi:hypothetical protein
VLHLNVTSLLPLVTSPRVLGRTLLRMPSALLNHPRLHIAALRVLALPAPHSVLVSGHVEVDFLGLHDLRDALVVARDRRELVVNVAEGSHLVEAALDLRLNRSQVRELLDHDRHLVVRRLADPGALVLEVVDHLKEVVRLISQLVDLLFEVVILAAADLELGLHVVESVVLVAEGVQLLTEPVHLFIVIVLHMLVLRVEPVVFLFPRAEVLHLLPKLV